MNKFRLLSGDVNFRQYGAKWYRKTDNTTYHIVELINMWDATGEENQSQYVVELTEINLDNVSDKQIKQAIESCGWMDSDNPNPSELMIVESVSSYGISAPMGSWDGNNYKTLIKAAKNESYALDDSDYHEKQLERPVNKLGSTAREYAAGDFISAMIRGIAAGDTAARIVGKIHGLKEEDINEIAADSDNKDFSLNP